MTVLDNDLVAAIESTLHAYTAVPRLSEDLGVPGVRGRVTGLSHPLANLVGMARLDVATRPEQLNLPGFRLCRLEGDLSGYWSVTVGGNWRIIFRFNLGNSTDVDLIEYH